MDWPVVDAAAGVVRWHDLREIAGDAADVPGGLKSLLRASTKEERQDNYWKLENRIVVQGNLFEAAEPLVALLLASLLEEGLELSAKRAVLELLFQIVHGEAHTTEAKAGRPGLGKRCRNEARKGIWLLYREVLQGDAVDQAAEILRVLEPDSELLESMLKLRQ